MQVQVKRILIVISCLAVFVLLPCGKLYAGADVYVSVAGNDGASGTSPNDAFATIRRARDAIRELKKTRALPKGGITVRIGGGEYYSRTSR